MTKTPFDKIAEGLQEAINIAQGLSKFLPEDMFPDKDDANRGVRLGRIEVRINGVEDDVDLGFNRNDPLSMGLAMKAALDYRDRILAHEPSHKVTLKIKGAK